MVCGNDGNTYTSECALKKMACLFSEKSGLEASFNGSCHTLLQVDKLDFIYSNAIGMFK